MSTFPDTRMGRNRRITELSYPVLSGLVFLFAWSLISCFVESGKEQEGPVLLIPIPDTLKDADSLEVILEETSGFQDTLWSATPPEAGILRVHLDGYQGQEALVLLKGFRKGYADIAMRLRVNLTEGTVERLDDPEPEVPGDPFPAMDSVAGLDTAFRLAWSEGSGLRKAERARVYLGTKNPPPLLYGSVRGGGVQVSGLLYGTDYFWQVVNLRDGKKASGPVWRFRTRPVPPSRLVYSQNPAVFQVGVPLLPNLAILERGSAESFTIKPALPHGLHLDTLSGTISGEAEGISEPVAYVVTARNASGATSVTLVLSVKGANRAPETPKAIIPSDGATGQDTVLELAWRGGDPDGDSISYRVWLGLGRKTLDSGTAVGPENTMRVGGLLTDTVYYWRVMSTDGRLFGQGEWSTFRTAPLPPSSLMYSGSSIVCTVGSAVRMPAPLVAGGQPSLFSVHPPLPQGLSLDGTTGEISGSPKDPRAEEEYTITASNEKGAAVAVIRMRVVARPVPDIWDTLAYTMNPAIYRVGRSIVPNAPVSQVGAPTGFSMEPPLPKGLHLDPVTGVVTGKPLAVFSSQEHFVKASMGSRKYRGRLVLQALANRPPDAPRIHFPISDTKMDTALTLAWSAEDPDGDSLAFILRFGLERSPAPRETLKTTTARLTGLLYDTTYYWSVEAFDGLSGTIGVTGGFVTSMRPPSGLSYSANPAVYREGRPIPPNPPTLAVGKPLAYAISPALPSGLRLDSNTGILTGSPAAAFPRTDFMVSASNSGGQTDVVLALEAKANNAPVFAPVFAPTADAQKQDTALTFSWAAGDGDGDDVAYVFHFGTQNPPPLDSQVPGTVTVKSGLAYESIYYWRVEAFDGLARTLGPVLSFKTRVTPPRRLNYTQLEVVYTRGVAIPPNIPEYQGGAGAQYLINPGLPSGLALDPETGKISGTPGMASERREYTVTANNFSGSVSTRIFIQVAPPHELVAHWDFDDGQGSTLEDRTGHGHKGLIEGPAWVTGIKGMALRFDGVDDQVRVPFQQDLNMAEYSLEAWVKTTETTHDQAIIDRVPPFAEQWSYRMMVPGPGNVWEFQEVSPGVVISDARSSFSTAIGNIALGKTPVTDGKWRHLVATRKDRLIRLYVDGVLDGSKSIGIDREIYSEQPLLMGACAFKQIRFNFKGEMDEVSLFNYALEDSTIAKRHADLKPPGIFGP